MKHALSFVLSLAVLSAVPGCEGSTVSPAAPSPGPTSAKAGSTSVRHAAPDAVAFAGAIARTRAAFVADGGSLWGASLVDIPFVGVEDSTLYASRDPGVAGFVLDDAGLWEGALPRDLAVAQTASAWAGRTWAMIRLPVETEAPDPVRLLAHEAFHVVGSRLLGGNGDQRADGGAALLDDARGRALFRLELRALARALEQPRGSASSRAAARDAIDLHAELARLATPHEIARERSLDRSEGLAEYTGMRLAGATDEAVAAALHRREASDDSFVRTACYLRGPAYGDLLDRFAPGWKTAVERGADPSDVLAGALSAAPAPTPATADRASSAAARYDGDAVFAAERERHRRRERRVAELTARFVDGRVLVLDVANASLTFDPNDQVMLGDAGVVMRGVGWKGANGAELSAPDGALVSPRWDEIRVPLGSLAIPEGPLSAPLDLRDPGFVLHLPLGWQARANGHETRLSRTP